VWLGHDFGNGFGAKVRYDFVTWAGSSIKDVSSSTIFISYEAAKNLAIALQFTSGDNSNFVKATNTDPNIAQTVSGIGDGTTSTLEFIGTF